jgi:hypothetical protein
MNRLMSLVPRCNVGPPVQCLRLISIFRWIGEWPKSAPLSASVHNQADRGAGDHAVSVGASRRGEGEGAPARRDFATKFAYPDSAIPGAAHGLVWLGACRPATSYAVPPPITAVAGDALVHPNEVR